ncbi:MAG: hypothetical protein ACI80V_002711 [Rhodothermales bacterium]
MFLGVLLAVTTAPGAASQALEGTYLVWGPAAIPGVGVSFGAVDLGRFASKEAGLTVEYRPAGEGGIRTIAVLGGAVRLLGSRQTVLQLPRASLDVDLGIRLGPALFFRFDETTLQRRKRFALIADPFIRIGFQRAGLFSLELGIHRPLVRAGFWIAL